MSTSRIRVVSYNVLSSHLASPLYMTKCDARHLDADTRLVRVCAKIEEEMDSYAETVFCLQEVSKDWLGPLHRMFSSRGYHFVTANYGRPFNGRMGVAMAWSTSEYRVSRVRIARVADAPELANLNSAARRDRSSSFKAGSGERRGTLMDGARRLFRTLAVFGGVVPMGLLTHVGKSFGIGGMHDRKADCDLNVVHEAMRRDNECIITELVPHSPASRSTRNGKRLKQQPFVIGTYHMPCLFGSAKHRQVMVVHAALFAQLVKQYAYSGRIPHILAGDFNFKPNDACYRLLTEGYLNPSDPDYPTAATVQGWDVNEFDGGALRSAYKTVNGKEPEFTNNSYTHPHDNRFVDTLDYIFHSKDFDVEEAMKTPAMLREDGEEEGPYPNEREPSDHVMIAATLTVT